MDIRPLTMEDAPVVSDLINRFERFWELPVSTPPSEIEDDLDEPFVDRDLDTRGYWLDGSLVAYGLVWHRPSGAREERAILIGVVDPDYRGQGIGRHLLDWQIGRGRESLSSCDPSLPWYLRTQEFDWIEDSFRLYRRFGLEPVRLIKEMIRPLETPVAARSVDGVEILPWDRSLDEGTREALNEAFGDHWGSTRIDPDSFQHLLERNAVRLDLSFQAVADSEVVGYSLNAFFPDDEQVTGRREGWVRSLGVKQAWRGRGVASALLENSFNAFIDAGLTHSILGVDTENPTGAFGLYEGLDYEMLHGTVITQLEVGHS
ncbi:MAG: GNAT family N-acetyltransferase [Acidimicrobiia bacterium]